MNNMNFISKLRTVNQKENKNKNRKNLQHKFFKIKNA